MGEINWGDELKGLTVDEMWVRFKNRLLDIQDICIPSRAIRARNSKPRWWSSEISRCMMAKKEAFRKLKEYNMVTDVRHYRKARDTLKRVIRHSKRVNEIRLASECSVRAILKNSSVIINWREKR